MIKVAQPSSWQVELWPNRSLSKTGLRGFLAILAGCFLVFFAITAAAPGNRLGGPGMGQVLLVIVPFVVVVFTCVAMAFRANNREGRYVERLRFDGDTLVIEADHPKRAARRWEFQAYWTRVMTRTTREVENQLVLCHKDCAVAIGGFLTPEERTELADEIKQALRRFNGALA